LHRPPDERADDGKHRRHQYSHRGTGEPPGFPQAEQDADGRRHEQDWPGNAQGG